MLWKINTRCNLKVLVHLKMKILSFIRLLTLTSFQTCKTFVHLWNTNDNLFDESVPPLTVLQLRTNLALQKVHKEIVKLIHMN